MERTWLITGCSSGLGKGIAKAVLARGDRAALTARDPAALAAFTAAYPGRALALPLDLSCADSIPKVVAETQRAFGGIDVLVNNAGHGYRAAIEEGQPHQVAELFAVNFFGPMDLIRVALPGMRERSGGWICNVTSIGGVRGALGNGYYSAAKAALERASEALAQEVAAFGIRVMLVEPGAFRTGFYGHRLAEPSTHLAAYDPIGDRYRRREGGETMILCVNTYRVKPGQRASLVADLVQEGIADQLQGLPGNVFFVFSLPIQDPEGLCLTDAWEDEAAFQAHLNHPATLRWGELKATYITDSQVRRYDL